MLKRNINTIKNYIFLILFSGFFISSCGEDETVAPSKEILTKEGDAIISIENKNAAKNDSTYVFNASMGDDVLKFNHYLKNQKVKYYARLDYLKSNGVVEATDFDFYTKSVNDKLDNQGNKIGVIIVKHCDFIIGNVKVLYELTFDLTDMNQKINNFERYNLKMNYKVNIYDENNRLFDYNSFYIEKEREEYLKAIDKYKIRIVCKYVD